MPKKKVVKVHVVQPDGVVSSHEFSEVRSLATLQKFCQGYIEEINVFYLGKRRTAFVNEEGRLKEMSLNIGATQALRAAHDGYITPPLFGPMVVMMT